MQQLSGRRTALGSIEALLVALVVASALIASNGGGVFAKDTPGSKTIALESHGIYSTGTSGSLDKGEHKYGEGELFEVGDGPSGDPVGVWKYFEVATGPVGVFGGMQYGTIRLDGRGDLFLRSVFGSSEGLVGHRGAIVGGTGDFAGASGTWETVATGPEVLEFTFDQPIASIGRRGNK